MIRDICMCIHNIYIYIILYLCVFNGDKFNYGNIMGFNTMDDNGCRSDNSGMHDQKQVPHPGHLPH